MVNDCLAPVSLSRPAACIVGRLDSALGLAPRAELPEPSKTSHLWCQTPLLARIGAKGFSSAVANPPIYVKLSAQLARRLSS